MMMVRSLGIFETHLSLRLSDEFAQTHHDELMVLAKILRWDEVRQVGSCTLRLVGDAHPQLVGIDAARQNMSVGGCMPPFSLPFSQGTPAR